jgi:hypothetical protein
MPKFRQSEDYMMYYQFFSGFSFARARVIAAIPEA